jgi:hypothetical protein
LLVEHAFIDRFIAELRADEERGAALNIETQRNFFPARPDREEC